MLRYRLFGLLMFWMGVLVWSPIAGAQYHLDEFGLRLGGGLQAPLETAAASPDPLTGFRSSQWAPHAGYNACAFYGHWVCGKNWGYQFELGWRGGLAHENLDFDTTALDPYDANQLHLGYMDVAALFKFRKHKHHTDTEWAFMLGPRLNIQAYGRQYLKGLEENALFPDEETPTGEQAQRWLPGIHLSVWKRYPWRKRRHLFALAGADWYPLQAAQTATGAGFMPLYVFVGAGLVFWNNR